MADIPILEPPFAHGPFVIERVTAKTGRRVLALPFVRVRLADDIEIHLTERQAVDFGRQLLAASREPALARLPAIWPPSSPDMRKPTEA